MFGTRLQFSSHELIDFGFEFILPKTKCRLTVVAIYDVASTVARRIDAVEYRSRIAIMLNIPFYTTSLSNSWSSGDECPGTATGFGVFA